MTDYCDCQLPYGAGRPALCSQLQVAGLTAVPLLQLVTILWRDAPNTMLDRLRIADQV
jgi:hypothetical protein